VGRDSSVALDPKKRTVAAAEQDPAARATWRAARTSDPVTQFVFVDETHTTRAMTRRYARAPRRERAIGRAPRNHGRPTTLLAALTPTGLDAPMTLPGAVNTAAFTAYVAPVLGPTLRPGQIVVLDNLSAHKGAAVAELIQARGCTLVFLPAYSPDFNPIELAFSKIKEFLRAAGARTQEALDEAIHNALETVTAHDAVGWFKHCGYSLA
jgi:transposase